MVRAVIDTNVLFEGLTSEGECGDVVDAWVARRFVPCVSTALALEYEEVLGGKLKGRKRQLALDALPALFDRVEFVPILVRVRPMSPDPDDDFVIECALNGHAAVVTRNLRDLVVAERALGIPVLNPAAFLQLLEAEPWPE